MAAPLAGEGEVSHGARRGATGGSAFAAFDIPPSTGPGDALCSGCPLAGTMVIHARGISGSDPGAVPGGSTKTLVGGGRGRNRIDGRVKAIAFTRQDATVTGSQQIVANDNYAPVAQVA